MAVVGASGSNLDLLTDLRALYDATGGGTPNVTVAVIDGPVDFAHEVFEGADLRTALGAMSVTSEAGNKMAEHGTHVASILFGQPGTEVEGICPRVRGVIIPVYDAATGSAPQLEVARAIELAIAEGVDIINFSGGQYSDTGQADQWLSEAVARCAEAGVLLIAAAGNDGCECLHVPAAASTALAVGAIDAAGEPMDFSNWGHGYSCNGITAPGADILGAVPGGGVTRLSGTSFATPMVTGVAALLLSMARAVGTGVVPLSSLDIREIMMTGAAKCASNYPNICQRLLSGTINVEGAVKAMSDAMLIGPAEVAPSGGCGCGGESASVSPESAVSASVTPSMADAPDGQNSVYALGNLSYDFGTEARRDSFKQLMPPVEINGDVVPPNPYDARQLVAYLGDNLSEARALTWTLNIELTPVYALEPTGAFGADLYNRLVEILAAEILAEGDEDNVQRVSIPGRLTGNTVRLFSGQVVPVLQLENQRGIYGWRHNMLVAQAAQAISGGPNNTADLAKIQENLRGFLDRIYYDMRNLGVLSSDRALNFAATNAFQAAMVFSEALGGGMQLETLETEMSPFARADSDAWDVKMKFFDPENTRRARRVYRFTIDVSELMPVTLGAVRSWTTAV
ncbi:MAG: PatA/PatG family cyanobactin maturation protease [Candidatus Nanopelagicales bacterium]|nr:PatA/PatG family cyanobactin maturation protease [Candidatus Nanopelagicales bacterium]